MKHDRFLRSDAEICLEVAVGEGEVVYPYCDRNCLSRAEDLTLLTLSLDDAFSDSERANRAPHSIVEDRRLIWKRETSH